MRTTTYVSLLGAAALAVVAGCTVKNVDQPALAGPSTFAHAITMVADRDTLTQNGVDFTDIRITALGPDGQAESVPLSAQIYVNGVAADYGTLSTKAPVTPATIRYTAPAAPTIAAGQVAQTVTIAVTPRNAGDFRGEMVRQIDIRLQPQGVILPTNPNLVANFTVAPAAPKVLDVVTFDATSTLSAANTACGAACTYSWNFGDGTTGTGQVTTHQFRAIGTFQTTLTVADFMGATSVKVVAIPVAAGTPPTAGFTSSPATPGLNQDVFFNATQSTAAAGRTITSYNWNFGDGDRATGVIVAHKFTAPGVYTVQLTVTDDAGSVSAPSNASLAVGPAVTGVPTASLTTTGSPRASTGTPANFNASLSRPGSGANITNYEFNWGDGDPVLATTNPIQSHRYLAAGTFVATVTITDSLGRTATAQVSVTVAP
jgi:PKD repeat protein